MWQFYIVVFNIFFFLTEIKVLWATTWKEICGCSYLYFKWAPQTLNLLKLPTAWFWIYSALIHLSKWWLLLSRMMKWEFSSSVVPFSGWLAIVCKDPAIRFDVNLTISSPMWQTVVQIISRVFPLYAEEVQPSEDQTAERSDLASLSTNTTAPWFICCQPLQVIHLEEICIHHCIFKLTK